MKKILIADDDPDILTLLASRLRSNNLLVVTAQDCNQAIKLDPTLIQPYLFRGFAFVYKGQIENAISDFKYCVDNSNDPHIRDLAASALEELQQATP